MITINNYKDLFEDIKDAHYQLNSYGFGPEWKIDELMNGDITYPCLYVIPTGSVTLDQTQHRRFEILVFDKVNVVDTLNASNIEVLSDAEQILNDIIKILRKETDNYDLIGEPDLEPFEARYTDVVTGYKTEVVIASELNSNYCDIPASSFVSPGGSTTSVTIVDQDGNVLATVNGGGSYLVTVLTTINDTITANVTTVVDNII
jgi:hypothetical protein